jgi:hypothetical protein
MRSLITVLLYGRSAGELRRLEVLRPSRINSASMALSYNEIAGRSAQRLALNILGLGATLYWSWECVFRAKPIFAPRLGIVQRF